MPRKDRNDYRCMGTAELCSETKYAINPNWEELAIVLAERLTTKRYDYYAYYGY